MKAENLIAPVAESRRAFLKYLLSATTGALPLGIAVGAPSAPRKIAAIVYGYALRWHPDNIVTRLLEGYWINDEFHTPSCKIVSLYTRIVPEIDLSRRLARAYGFKIHPSISEALTLGTGKLAVDGVIVVSESHGLIPFDDNPYRQFSRKLFRYFARVESLCRFSTTSISRIHGKNERDGRTIAQARISAACRFDSSVTFRRPEVDFPLETPFQELMAVASLPGEHLQSYGYHGIELLQSIAERRPGGETGVRAVRYVDGPEVLEAHERGLWSRDLLEAALAHSPTRGGRSTESLLAQAMAFLIEYRDGLRGTVILIPVIRDFNFAARVRGDAKIASFVAYIPWENSNNFSCLVRCAERLFETGKPDYPIERTLIASGTLDFLMRSRRQGHRQLETPELKVSYRAPAQSNFCRGPGS